MSVSPPRSTSTATVFSDQVLPAGGGLYLGVDDGEEELFCLKEFGASLCLGPAKTYTNPDGTSLTPPK